MEKQEFNFNNQSLTISNEDWNVELLYESTFSDKKEIKDSENDKIIKLSEQRDWNSILKLTIRNKSGYLKTCLLKGIDGGSYLHKSDKTDNSQSVKLIDNDLIMSLGFTFLSLNIQNLEINWKIRPDMAEIFEFYDLEKDFLLRGELGIHRIDQNGNVKWSYSGRDIWVNIDGNDEVKIEKDQIHLVDFQSNEYKIDFDGNTLEDNPVKN